MKHLEDELEAFLEGWLDLPRRRQVEEHLANCPRCREALELQTKVKVLMGHAAPEIPTDRMWRAIEARLDAGGESRQGAAAQGGWWSTGRIWATSAAGMLAMAAVLWGPAFLAPRQAAPTKAENAPVPSQQGGVSAALQAKPAAYRSAALADSRGKREPHRSLRAQAPAQRQEGDSAPALAPGSAAVESMDRSTPMISAQPAGFGTPRSNYASAPAPMQAEKQDASAAPAALPAALGAVDQGGSWNWNPLQAAVDQNNWPQVASELKAARQRAGRSVERSFAASALNLLGAPGQPLAALNLPPESDAWTSDQVELVVLQAGNWRLDRHSGQAVFLGPVATREKGVRSDGSSFVMDLGGQRGVFSQGTEFTRLAHEPVARILNAADQQISDNRISADGGAVFDYQTGVLNLNK